MSALATYVLLRAFADELARCGMRTACTSPGSRCVPLVLSLARERRIACYSHVDERCAGFFALGAAKASGRPVAVTCTSGTAAAELLPAAIEAYEARVPLLLLSADRPPELRENGAGQAIDQLKLYGSAAKWFFEVDALQDAAPARLRWIRTLACRAYWTALAGRPGAVHLNFPLREPLVTDEPLPVDESGRAGGRPYVRCASASALGGVPRLDGALAAGGSQTGAVTEEQVRLLELIAAAKRGVLVAGRYERSAPLGDAAARFCEAVGWPLLADPMSGARRGTAAVAHYDALLRDEAFTGSHRPDVILRVGDLPVSKPLRAWLTSLHDVRQVALDPEDAWQDPGSVVSDRFALEPAAALGELTTQTHSPEAALPPANPEWLASWREADEVAARALSDMLARDGEIDETEPEEPGLSEPAVARELGVLLPARSTLFVASSMPVRDIETIWPARDDPPRVLCNRGANGIDGTVSSAFGAAAVAALEADATVAPARTNGPVVLLIGDVALAHDIGGLLAAKRLGLALTIVLLDNGGGGIFDFLPVSRAASALQEDVYATHIATPTGLDAAKAAELYGLQYVRAQTIPELRDALQRAIAPGVDTTTLVHVQTDRAENVALHGRIWKAVSQALAGRSAGVAKALSETPHAR